MRGSGVQSLEHGVEKENDKGRKMHHSVNQVKGLGVSQVRGGS